MDLSAEAATYPLEKLKRDRPTFDPSLKWSTRSLGKGSNNKAYSVVKDGVEYVMRVPRRRSDTQQWGSALWEFRHTLRASQLGVCPTLHDAFYARHADDKFTSGLYMMMDRFDCDLEEALVDSKRLRAKLLVEDGALLRSIADQTVAQLDALAKERMFLYDLKPSNIVLRFSKDGKQVESKLVDFGKDFVEWDTRAADPDARAPVVIGLRERISAQEATRGIHARSTGELVTHVLFAGMLVQLSAVTTRVLYDDRETHRMGEEERKAMHPFSAKSRELLASMQGVNVDHLCWLLRTDEVRGVLRHYQTRRCCGTQRTLLYACGTETFETVTPDIAECIPQP